ncbi:hypothetical protein SSPO_021740 [Streptomyces antimycoticus]|uniref:Carbohydrate kinase PfkB domain-containing protein n=1 Tax=Streptomyces antimycoticus TaxID=68175 RepID=A0A499USE7_9ACTN|nr:PfkB family carbohydrate kinase [Streptomyces antimycoticus]BBJ39456.1 hypothetical protein SSPO_021740 [Streptomyces antimycoticus]
MRFPGEADRPTARLESPSGVTVLGECVADAFTDLALSGPSELALRALPGGGPANTAVALARLGTPTRFLGRLSHDVFGTLFRSRLSDSGADLSGSVAAPEPSTLAVATLDETGPTPARTALRLPRTAPTLVCLADILRLNEDDLALLLPGASPEEACDTWHAAGARLVVITLGSRGALASLDSLRVTVPAPAVNAVDTVGAGDSFTAGLLHRLAALGHLRGRPDRLSLRVRAETQQVPESERRLRKIVAELKKTVAWQKAEIEQLRFLTTRLDLAGAVRTDELACRAAPATADNVVSLTRPASHGARRRRRMATRPCERPHREPRASRGYTE